MGVDRVKYYLVETEYNENTSIVDVLKNELEANKEFAKRIFDEGRAALVDAYQDEFAEIISDMYPMLFSVTTKLSVAAEILNVKTLDEFDVFCENFLENKVDIIEIADIVCPVLNTVVFGDESEIKCLNLYDVDKIVQDIQRAVENPAESLKSGKKWMSMSPTEMVSLSRFLFPAYEAMKERKEAGTDSYLLCMPQH